MKEIEEMKFKRVVNEFEVDKRLKNKKIVKSKKKVSDKLKRQLLKNYGFYLVEN